MVNVPGDLGERIILATRMAVTAHWQEVLNQPLHEIHDWQQLSSSGTASESVTEDQLPTATFGGAGSRPRRPSRLGKFFRRSRR